METLFIKLLNMSIAASWLILLVLLFRVVCKKAPKWINYVMWAMVAFRLICPVSFESVLSLVPSQETVPQDIIYEEQPMIQSGSTAINNVVNPVISKTFESTPENSVNPMQKVLFVDSVVWAAGMLVLALYALISYLRLQKKVSEAVWIKENIWQCDYIGTAFILGVIRPRIYVPSSIGEGQMEYVIAHEKEHIKQKDYWWKPLGFILLTIYWFHPLIWIAYIALCKDIELACDARVIKDMNGEEKKAYSIALLECSTSGHLISACPVAFGESGVERRVKSVLNYKKPTFWITLLAVFICIVAAVGFLTNPSNVGTKDTEVVGTYAFEIVDGTGVDEMVLILREDQVFIVELAEIMGGRRLTGTYEQKGDTILLQINKNLSCTLQVKGDELTFIDNKSVFLSYFSDDPAFIQNDRMKRWSSIQLIESGYPEDVIDALDIATKDMLVGEIWGAPTVYEEYYFDKEGNCTYFERRSNVGYEEPENIEDYVLKLTLITRDISSFIEEETYYEYELEKIKVICFYEWLQAPSTFGTDYKLSLSWNSKYFSMADSGFRKVDKYVVDGQEYISSYEDGYARGGEDQVSWYTQIKGTMGIEPERLYGCAIIDLVPKTNISDLNVNMLLEYEVNGKNLQALTEYHWDTGRVYRTLE